MRDAINLSVQGFLKIYDPVSNSTVFEGKNAIHYEHMSQALAWSIANEGKGTIYKMVFGNGGTTVDPTGIITYLTPNSSGANASLYNQTYSKVVDKNMGSNRDPSRNYVQTRHVTGMNYSDVFITCLLDYGEPAGQQAFDISTNNDSAYIFDELGLLSYKPDTDEGMLITHVVFHPVQKSLNRLIQIDYTIRIQTLTGDVENVVSN